MKNYDLVKNEKVWSGTKSNITFMHAFLSGPDQPAACRKNIRSGGGVLLAAVARARTMLPTNYCENCEAAVIAMVNRREDAMQPSTGEGDYLPPAEDASVAPETCCDHAPMYHGARGCDECVCAAPRNRPTNTPDDKEETVTIPLTGPLTERQTDILNYMAKGHRYQKIGTLMGLSVHQVKLEAHALIKKMGAQTAAHALATYATAQAYSNAAAQVRSGKIWAPGGEVDEHVNYVLDGIADLFKGWSDQRMPK